MKDYHLRNCYMLPPRAQIRMNLFAQIHTMYVTSHRQSLKKSMDCLDIMGLKEKWLRSMFFQLLKNEAVRTFFCFSEAPLPRPRTPLMASNSAIRALSTACGADSLMPVVVPEADWEMRSRLLLRDFTQCGRVLTLWKNRFSVTQGEQYFPTVAI